MRWPDAAAGGHMLLAGAAVPAAVAVLSTAAHRWGLTPRKLNAPRIAQVSSWLLLAFLTTATLHLLVLLGTGDFSVRYVWQHSASYQDLARTLSAMLAGEEGSFLVWALFASALAAWTAAHWRRSRRSEQPDAAVVHLVTASVALAVLVITIASTPFQAFADAFPSLDGVPVEGRGLNPVLANHWMAPHTLLTFAGYALIGLAFAIATTQLLSTAQGRASDAQHWRRPCRLVARWAWLLLSAALLTGTLWAYEEMTFGWFWSWDPVESATLSVWLLLTAALHVGGETGGRRERVYAPLLMMLAFVGVVFASFVTRSGLHPSVHAFTSGSAGLILGMLLAALVIGTATLAVFAGRTVPAVPDTRPWGSWAAWVLLAAAGVIVWGLTYPIAAGLVGRTMDLDTRFFVTSGYLVAICVLLLMGFGLQASRGTRRDARLMLGFFVTLTGVAALVRLVPALEFMSADQLPPAAYALFAVAERWWSDWRALPATRAFHTGSAVAHVGVVLVVVGAVFASVLSSTVTVSVSLATSVGRGDGLAVQVTDLEQSEHLDGLGTLVEEREVATLEVRSDRGLVAAGEATVSTYPERAMGRHAGVLIERGLLSDSQVIYHGIAELTDGGVPVTVRRIPFVSLLWAGLVFLVAGMGAVLASTHPSRSGVPREPVTATHARRSRNPEASVSRS
jgi:cytochrome c-type biogenesis protein CcmF